MLGVAASAQSEVDAAAKWMSRAHDCAMLRDMMRPNLRCSVSLLSLIMVLLGSSASQAQTVPTGFVDQPIVTGLSRPVAFEFVPDSPGHVRVLVAQQLDARVRLVRDGVLLTDVLTVPGIAAGGEKGLLGIAMDPAFPARPYLYVHGDDASGTSIRISRFTLTGDLFGVGTGALSADPASRFDLIADVPDLAGNHNGGTVRFGPDGMLYASFGEDADACGAQDSTLLKGVILRLDVSRIPAGPGSAPRAMVTPADNPYVASADSNARLVAAFGLRNPFRFQIDMQRQWLVIADVGQDQLEELDLLRLGAISAPGTATLGADFGWPWFEGDAPLDVCAGNSAGVIPPIVTYDHSGGAVSIISAGAYHAVSGAASNWPAEYEGDLFFSDYSAGFLRRLEQGAGGWSLAAAVPGQPTASNWGGGYTLVSDYRVGPDGSLWYVRNAGSGALRRIMYQGGGAPPPPPSSFTIQRFDSHPQPAVGSVTFDLDLSESASIELRLFDARGRRVRTLRDRTLFPAGPQNVVWDGLGDHGERVPAGQYFARLEVRGIRRAHGITLLR